MYKRLLVVTLVLPALQSLVGEQRPETNAPKRVNAERGFRPQARGGFHNTAVAAQSANLPPIVKQFEETSYYLKDIAMLDASTGWAVGEPHWDQAALLYKVTIIKTTNGGDSWTAEEAGVVESFSGICFIDANQGWVVGTNGTILHTTDGGAHWVKQPAPATDEFRGVFFTDANTGWATSLRPVHHGSFGEEDDWLSGIWSTRDGGTSWAQQQTPSSGSILNRIDFVDSATGWAVGVKFVDYDGDEAQHTGVIYHTSDGGRTWVEQYSTAVGFTFTAVDFVDAANGWAAGFPHAFGDNDGSIFHTSDGGKSWGRQKAADTLWGVRFADRNRGYAIGTMYGAAWGPPVWRTLDGGATWIEIPMLKHEGEGLYGVAIVGNQFVAIGDHDFMATSSRPWDSCGTSSGLSCDSLFNQSYLNTHLNLHDVFFANENHGCAVGNTSFDVELWGQVILCTGDGGATWTTRLKRPPKASTLSLLGGVYFTDPLDGWAVGWSGFGKSPEGIWHTDDGGTSWKEQGQDICGDGCEFHAVQFLSRQTGWALPTTVWRNIKLAHTEDGGVHWSWVDTGIDGNVSSDWGGLDFTDDKHGWAVGSLGVVIHTEDGGAHWVRQTLPNQPICCPRLYSAAFVDDQKGWIAGENLYVTTDGGTHWSYKALGFQSSPYGGGDLQDIQFVDSRNGWITGDSGILMRTTDGGDTWTFVDGGTSAQLRSLHFVDPQHGWIVGDSGTILSYAGDRAPPGKPAVFSVVNGASYLPGMAAATWISILGANLSATTRTWNNADFTGSKLPTQLDGVRVSIGGQPAYPYYISPSQLNILVPAGVPDGPATVQVSTSQGTSDPFVAQQAKYSPSVFMYSIAGGQYVIAQASDGSWIGGLDLMYEPGMPSRMREAKPGEIITIYGTGFGPTNPPVATDSLVTQPAPLAAPVTFYFGRTTAEVVWAGLIGSGLYQFNIKVPNLPDGGNVIVAEIGGYRSQGDSVISVGR